MEPEQAEWHPRASASNPPIRLPLGVPGAKGVHRSGETHPPPRGLSSKFLYGICRRFCGSKLHTELSRLGAGSCSILVI